MAQDLQLLFITMASSGLEKHLLENLHQIKSFTSAMEFAKQWEKTKAGIQAPIAPMHAFGKLSLSDREKISPNEENEGEIAAFTNRSRKP